MLSTGMGRSRVCVFGVDVALFLACISAIGLHLDHWHAARRDPFTHLSTEWREGIHHCIVAGDLINDGTRRWPRALEWLSRQLPCARIAIFFGNHDFYEGRIDREDKLRAAERVGATYGQKAVLEIGRTRLLCCTLWTDFNLFGAAAQPSAMYDARRLMNDYRSIRVERDDFRHLPPADTRSRISACHGAAPIDAPAPVRIFSRDDRRHRGSGMTDDNEPNLVTSGKSQTITVDGVRFQIEIHRLDTDRTWTLEVVDPDGTSHVWEEQFASDKDARDVAIKAIETEGAAAFMRGDNVIPFRSL